jgi:hypothetical protein
VWLQRELLLLLLLELYQTPTCTSASQGAGPENFELDDGELEIMASPVKEDCVICEWMQKAVTGRKQKVVI